MCGCNVVNEKKKPNEMGDVEFNALKIIRDELKNENRESSSTTQVPSLLK